MPAQDDEWWEITGRADTNLAKTREWALNEKLPDSSYDPERGWALDQLAMNVAPTLLVSYKRRLRDYFEGKAELHAFGEIQHPKTTELENKVKESLLEDCNNVTGLLPGSYHPATIPHALLADMHPNIPLSALQDVSAISPRRYEKVRVFVERSQAKGTAGRKPTYDWPSLEAHLEAGKPDISTEVQLIEYCRENVNVCFGKKGSPLGPDTSTIRAAIAKYRLGRFIKPRQQAARGN